MRVMILGAGGMLGQDLVASAPSHFALFPLTGADLDITDPAALESKIAQQQPEAIVNASGYTRVDQAESEPALAFRVNGEAVAVRGTLSPRAGARRAPFGAG